MEGKIRWDEFIRAFDYTTTHKKTDSLLCWESWEKDPAGITLKCQTALENPVSVRIDILGSDVLRFRMSAKEIGPGPREILISHEHQPVSYQVEESAQALVIKTDILKVVLPQRPWGMKVFDLRDPNSEIPFFQQQFTDRAYGPGYEVPPVGYLENENGQMEVRESVLVQPGEAFYGFGERFTSLNKWGLEFKSWAVDSGNVSSLRAYKNVPFYMSSAGYGVLINSSFPMVFRIGSESNSSYSFHVLDHQLDYLIIRGPEFKQILRRYADLTGFAPVPPKWSFGFWISRCLYTSRKQVEQVVKIMREKGFPCDVVSIDPYWMGESPWCTYEFDEEIWPDPEGMMADFKDQGIKTCLWITPYLPEGTPYFELAKEKGYLIQKPDGNPSPVLEAFAGVDLAAIDFTNPDATSWWKDILQGLLDKGAATFKTDFAEQAPVDAIYSDGRTGTEMHNIYPLLYNRAAFELTEDYFGRGLVWGRSGYAGSQRYPVQWGGDSYASFPQMVGQLRGLLSYGLSGIPFCSHDVGGFDYQPEAFDTDEDLDAFPRDSELYIRWLQFGVFSSHLRAHGKQPREPWEYGDQAAGIAMDYLKLRYRLLPYIYTQAVMSTETGLPMVRPLVLEYQDDPNTRDLDLEYMFGSDFLVAPILSRGNTRKVYLPAGEWFDYWTKSELAGGRWIDVEAPLDKLPLFVRTGAVIPYGPEMDYVGQQALETLELEFYGSPDQPLRICDEDQPEMAVRSVLDGTSLTLDIESDVKRVEVKVYGLELDQLEINGTDVDLKKTKQAYQGGIDF